MNAGTSDEGQEIAQSLDDIYPEGKSHTEEESISSISRSIVGKYLNIVNVVMRADRHLKKAVDSNSRIDSKDNDDDIIHL